MSKEETQKMIDELIENYAPISRLIYISREIERNGGVSDAEREEMETLLDECKLLTEGVENILKGA